jgi:hypothetical protein
VALTEFSLHFFEYNLPDASNDSKSAKNVIEQIINQIATYQGLLVCLLHPSNYQDPVFRQLWEFIQESFMKERIFIRTLKDHLDWLRKKERIKIEIADFAKNQTQYEVTVPDSLHHFAFEVIGKAKPVPSKGVETREIDTDTFQLTTTKHKFSIRLEKK